MSFALLSIPWMEWRHCAFPCWVLFIYNCQPNTMLSSWRCIRLTVFRHASMLRLLTANIAEQIESYANCDTTLCQLKLSSGLSNKIQLVQFFSRETNLLSR